MFGSQVGLEVFYFAATLKMSSKGAGVILDLQVLYKLLMNFEFKFNYL